jgi:hypothetical protein
MDGDARTEAGAAEQAPYAADAESNRTRSNPKSNQLSLPFWYGLGNQLTNIRSEFHTLQTSLKDAELNPDTAPPEIVAECRELLVRFAASARNPFATILSRYLALQQISQKAMLIDPPLTGWNTIQRRFLAGSEKARDLVQRYPCYKLANSYFGGETKDNGPEPAAGTADQAPAAEEGHAGSRSMDVRRALRELKIYYDELVALKIWHATAIRWRTATLMVLTVMLVGAIYRHLAGEPVISQPDLIQFILCGALGGTLSSIVRPTPIEPPLPGATNALLRPVLGGVAALILFSLLQASVFAIDKPAMCYLAAIAIGFSDGALTNILEKTGQRISESATATVGHPAADEK